MEVAYVKSKPAASKDYKAPELPHAVKPPHEMLKWLAETTRRSPETVWEKKRDSAVPIEMLGT